MTDYFKGLAGHRIANTAFYRDDGVIWEANFDQMPLSTTTNAATLRSTLAGLGLTLTRASAATVQTSASTIVSSGIGVDDPRIGNGGYGQGLVLEESRTNSCDLSDPFTWGATFATPTHVAGPDGATSASRLVDADAANIGYQARAISYAASTQYIASCWINAEESTPAGSLISFNTNDGGASNTVARASVLGQWTRKVGATYVSGAGPSSNFSIVPAHGAAADAGAASFAFFQRENGKFATEAIITSGASATRSAERLTLDAGSRAVVNGRFGMEVIFVPKASTANIGATGFYLVNPTAGGSRCYSDSSGFLVAEVGGTAISSTNAVPFGATDTVKYYLEVGNGAPYAKISINGVVSAFTFAAGSHTSYPTTALDLLQSGATGQLSSWVQKIRFYNTNRRPVWAS